ncbi:MAG: hypothetical protein WBO69_12440 [Thermoanaerobaculia bacterium]
MDIEQAQADAKSGKLDKQIDSIQKSADAFDHFLKSIQTLEQAEEMLDEENPRNPDEEPEPE